MTQEEYDALLEEGWLDTVSSHSNLGETLDEVGQVGLNTLDAIESIDPTGGLAASFVPGVGVLQDSRDVAEALRMGDYPAAAGNVGLAALGILPGGSILGKGFKKAKGALSGVSRSKMLKNIQKDFAKNYGKNIPDEVMEGLAKKYGDDPVAISKALSTRGGPLSAAPSDFDFPKPGLGLDKHKGPLNPAYRVTKDGKDALPDYRIHERTGEVLGGPKWLGGGQPQLKPTGRFHHPARNAATEDLRAQQQRIRDAVEERRLRDQRRRSQQRQEQWERKRAARLERLEKRRQQPDYQQGSIGQRHFGDDPTEYAKKVFDDAGPTAAERRATERARRTFAETGTDRRGSLSEPKPKKKPTPPLHERLDKTAELIEDVRKEGVGPLAARKTKEAVSAKKQAIKDAATPGIVKEARQHGGYGKALKERATPDVVKEARKAGGYGNLAKAKAKDAVTPDFVKNARKAREDYEKTKAAANRLKNAAGGK